MLKIGREQESQAIQFPNIMDILGWETRLVSAGMEGELGQHSNSKQLDHSHF